MIDVKHISIPTLKYLHLCCSLCGAKLAVDMPQYRGDLRWHFITKCGLKVRAGRSLAKIWGVWRRSHLQGPEKIGSVLGVPYMDFQAVKIVHSRGSFDMQCVAV